MESELIGQNQLDKLLNEIEGRLNDFENGESDKEETIKSFAELIGKISVNVAKGELRKIIQNFNSEKVVKVDIIRAKLEIYEKLSSSLF